MELTRRSLEIGPINIFGRSLNPTIHWYGVIIVLGIITATSIVAWLAKKDDEDPEIVWNGVVWVVVLGVVGARLWSVLFPAGDLAVQPAWDMDYITDLENGPLAIWSGGLSIFGAVLGGLIGVLAYSWRHKLNRLQWADRAAIGLPVGQAIGRWGNFVNQELYGKPTDLPWGVKIDFPVAEYANETHFHPLFLYESIINFVLFGLLFWLWRKRRANFQNGDFFLMYLMGYTAVRFLLEFLRVEVPMVGNINASQMTTGIVFVFATFLFVMRHRTPNFVAETYPPFGETGKKKSSKKKSSSKKKNAKA